MNNLPSIEDLNQFPPMLSRAAKNWFRLADELNWCSYDPFDILLSPYLAHIRLYFPLGGRIIIRIGKFCGNKTRKVLKINPHVEAKALSDFLAAAVLLSMCGQSWAVPFVNNLTAKLKGKAIPTSNGVGWGLDFPYVSRFTNVPAKTPNIYQTINAVESLLDVYDYAKEKELLNVCAAGLNFIIKDLGFFRHAGMKWVRYWAELDAPIINIQALCAGLFARAGRLVQNEFYYEIANQLANTVVQSQGKEGSWLYSLDGKANFIDGFHTGYILQGLQKCILFSEMANGDRQSVCHAVQIGFQYFKSNFLTTSGIPRLYSSGKPSFDGQNIAQCVQTLTLCADSPIDIFKACHMWQNIMTMPLFQDAGHNSNYFGSCFPQLRWSLGPAVLATAVLLMEIDQPTPKSL